MTTRILLIGGTSHTGKSTLGQRVADELGWRYLSTDQLSRHPGRPWSLDDHPIPADVIEHYSTLSPSELLDAVTSHYTANVWPIVSAIVRCTLNNPYDRPLVFEGSGILPELLDDADFALTRAYWLTAPSSLIEARVHETSKYADRSADEMRLIDAFVARASAFNARLEAALRGDPRTLPADNISVTAHDLLTAS